MGLCHDYIVMNSSKGFFCLPEVNVIYYMLYILQELYSL